MKLFNITSLQKVLIAEINDDNTVIHLHPSIQDSINKERGVAIPAIHQLREQFDGLSHISRNHPKYGKAVKLYLDLEIIPRSPSTFVWVDNVDPQA